MDTKLVVIIIGVFAAGVALGALAFARRNGGKEKLVGSTQSVAKARNKKRIFRLAKKRGEITNNDVEQHLGVSDATATNYLTELEAAGKLTQHNETGRGVYYTPR